jgi:hypothetical protein
MKYMRYEITVKLNHSLSILTQNYLIINFSFQNYSMYIKNIKSLYFLYEE